MSQPTQTIKVFISYSWTNEEHVEWVVQLAERLRGDGIDVVLDQWDLKEGHDTYVFMEQMVTDPSVTKVLAVCDAAYAKKADARKGGVGTESQIISKDIYEKVDQEKFIPLVRERDESGKVCVPVLFRSRKYIDFTEDEAFEDSYEHLIRNLYSRPARMKPPLGQAPAHLFVEPATQVKTAGKLQRLRDAAEKGRPHTQAMMKDYLDCLGDAFGDFRIDYDPKGEQPFDETVIGSINAFTPYRDNFIDFIEVVAAYIDRDEAYETLHEFFDRVLSYQFRPDQLGSSYPISYDNYRFIVYELFLYLLATLVRSNKAAAAATFIEGKYHYAESFGGTSLRTEGISAFEEPIESLDRMRNDRLHRGLQWSVTADILKGRATHRKVSFLDLYQIDVLLFMRKFFPNPEGAAKWYPRCIAYGGRLGTLPLFAKAESERGIKPLKYLLRITSLTDLVQRINAMFSNQQFQQAVQTERYFHAGIDRLLNIEGLRRAVASQK